MSVSRKGFSSESLQIGKDGAVIYQGNGPPSGTLGQNANLYIRKDSPNEKLYIKIDTTWKQLGLIASIATSNGITGGPITETGTLELTGQASELHNMATDGFFYRNGTTISARSFGGTNGQITVTNSDGSAGNPIFAIATNPTLPGNVTISGSDLIISGGNGRIQGIGAVMSATDATSKSYVDGIAQGLSIKNSVLTTTLNNITLSGEQTIDDVAVVDGNRVLVKDQTDASENGIYIVSTGAWSRSLDMDDWSEVPSSFTFVKNGTINADTGWVITSLPGGTIDVNDMDWVQFSSAGNLDQVVKEIQTKDTNFDFYNEYNVPLTNPSSATISETYCVILLFPITPNGLNQCIGNFKLRNINTATTANSALLSVNAISSANNINAQYNVTENELFDDFRLVTFTYNTVDYIGIDFRSSSGHVMENRYFTGMYNTQDNEELQVIPYYNFNTTTAINSEINSSITDYTPSANKQIVFSSDGYFKGKRGVVISAGDTSERMSNPPTATLRFNTDLGEFEYFDGSNWTGFSGAAEDAELLAALAFVSA